MCRLKVKVTANSHRPGLVGLVDDVIQLKVAAPPADGQANQELCRFLAELFGLAPSLISVRYGHSARQKVVEVQGVDEGRLFAILRQRLAKNKRE
jgi:hypothetical protein